MAAPTLTPTFATLPNCNTIAWFGGICETDVILVYIFFGTLPVFLASAIWCLALYCQRKNKKPNWHWYISDLKQSLIFLRGFSAVKSKLKLDNHPKPIDPREPMLECQACGRLCNLDAADFPSSNRRLFHFCNSERRVIYERKGFKQPRLPFCPCSLGLWEIRNCPGLIRPEDASGEVDNASGEVDHASGKKKTNAPDIPEVYRLPPEAPGEDNKLDSKKSKTITDLVERKKTTTMLPMHWDQMLQIRTEQLVAAADVNWEFMPANAFDEEQNIKPGFMTYVKLFFAVGGAFYNAFAIVYAMSDLWFNGNATGGVKEHWAFLARCQIWFEFLLILIAAAIVLASIGYHAYNFRGHSRWLTVTIVAFFVEATAWLNVSSMYLLPMFMNVPFFLTLIGMYHGLENWRPLRLVDKWSIWADFAVFVGSRPIKVAMLFVCLGAFVLKVFRLAISPFPGPIGKWNFLVWNMLIQFLHNIMSLMEAAAQRNLPTGELRGSILLRGRSPFFRMLKTSPACQKSYSNILYVAVLWIVLPPVNLYMLFVWNAWYSASDVAEDSKAAGKVLVSYKDLLEFIKEFPSFKRHAKNWEEVSEAFKTCMLEMPFDGHHATVALQRGTKQAVKQYFDHLNTLGDKGDLLARDGLADALEDEIKKSWETKSESPSIEGDQAKFESLIEGLSKHRKDKIVIGGSIHRLIGGSFGCHRCPDQQTLEVSFHSQGSAPAPTPLPLKPVVESPQTQCEECKELQKAHGDLDGVISRRDLLSGFLAWIEDLPSADQPNDFLDWNSIEPTFQQILKKHFQATNISVEDVRREFHHCLYQFPRGVNLKNHPLAFGTKPNFETKLYCGRVTEDLSKNLHDVDGRCGPEGEEQCDLCKTFVPECDLTRGTLANGFLLLLGVCADIVQPAGFTFNRDHLEEAFRWWLKEDHTFGGLISRIPMKKDEKEKAERKIGSPMHAFVVTERYNDLCIICRKRAKYRCVLDCGFNVCAHHFRKNGFYHMAGTYPVFPIPRKGAFYGNDRRLFCGAYCSVVKEKDQNITCEYEAKASNTSTKRQCDDCIHAERCEKAIIDELTVVAKWLQKFEKVPVPDKPPNTPVTPLSTPTYVVIDEIDA